MVQLSDRRPDHKEVTREAPLSSYRMDTSFRFIAAECRPGRDMARRDRIRHRGDIRHRPLCCIGLQTANRTFSAMTPTGQTGRLDLGVTEKSPHNGRKCKENIVTESTVNSKGQTTVPAEVRAALHVERGTRLEWHVMPNRDVIVRAKTLSILDLAGSVEAVNHVDIEDMNPWRG